MAICPRLSVAQSSPTCAALPKRIFSSTDDRYDTRNLIDWNLNDVNQSIYRDPMAGFFRPQSIKVYVFVTDDDSTMMTAAEFDSIFQQRFPGQRAKSFGFIGLGSNVSPCQARTGTVYQSMTVASGGKYYNICDQDWSANFNDLTQKVIEAGQTEFALSKGNVSKVIRVRLDGRDLVAGEYQIAGTILSIRKDLITPGVNHRVEITYEYR
jgi:hypothetical protein